MRIRFAGCLGDQWSACLDKPIVTLWLDDITGNFDITVDRASVDFSPSRGDGYTLLEEGGHRAALAWRIDGREFVAVGPYATPELADAALRGLREDVEMPQPPQIATVAGLPLLWEGDQA